MRSSGFERELPSGRQSKAQSWLARIQRSGPAFSHPKRTTDSGFRTTAARPLGRPGSSIARPSPTLACQDPVRLIR